MHRRSFLLGLSAICAPAIIRPGLLMPVKPMAMPSSLTEDILAAYERRMLLDIDAENLVRGALVSCRYNGTVWIRHPLLEGLVRA